VLPPKGEGGLPSSVMGSRQPLPQHHRGRAQERTPALRSSAQRGVHRRIDLPNREQGIGLLEPRPDRTVKGRPPDAADQCGDPGGSVKQAGKSGWGSVSCTVLCIVTRQAILSSFHAGSCTPRPQSGARIWSRPPSTATTATGGTLATRGGSVRAAHPRGEGLCGSDSDLLEGLEVDSVGRTYRADGAACHDFSPVLGQVSDLSGSRRLGLLEGHRSASLELGEIEKKGTFLLRSSQLEDPLQRA
jgi:hypothetical protein